MEQLVARKLELLKLQEEKIKRFNEILTGTGGLNHISRITCKNLEAAIAASKNPGVIKYYQAPDETQKIIESGELKKLQLQIDKLQKDLDNVNQDIRDKEDRSAIKEADVSNNVTSLKQWFSQYGTPKPAPADFYSSFAPNAKVYGGTTHYAAFKTQSKSMKLGRLTR